MDIKIIGLEAASAATVNWPRRGYVTIIRYDSETCEVWASDATSDQLAGPYDVCRTSRHMSADQIRAAIFHREIFCSGGGLPIHRSPARSVG